MYYPSDFEYKIDFSAIRLILKEKCISSLGKEQVDKIVFSADYEQIILQISRAEEMLRLMRETTEAVPVGDFFDIRQGLSRVRVEGLYLDENEVFELWKALDAARRLVSYIAAQQAVHYPHLQALLKEVQLFPEIIRRIDSLLDKFGKIKDNASQELSRIRKEMSHVQSSVSRSLQAILRQAQADGYVEKDAVPSVREGRLVIPVSPAFKRKISGIVHDESATGKTVFIEPTQVVEINNRLRELEGEERREVIRILIEFTNFVRPFTEGILQSQYFLGEIDFLRSKALFAEQIGAIKPQIDRGCLLEWSKAVHPILYLALQKQQKKIVPLDIMLNEQQRILLISGPNAGGKSVCLKTVALLQYMLQCGLLIPVHESSRCGIFERLFIDIGDEQSIENDLSTYSSHLLNMKFFIRNSNGKTLLLIDEFGTGTEPVIGGALAEATLERFNRNKVFAVITTHYTNLKHYAEDAEGIINGAMLYDRQHLQPLFILQTGNPGSSFAVEIARKIGLPEDLIADAAAKVGSEHLDYDKHLQDIIRDKRYWERKRQDIRLKEKKIDAVLARYETEMADINRKKKEIALQAKTDALQLLNEANTKIENIIRQIKEAQAEKEKTKSIRKEFLEYKEKIKEQDVAELKPKTKKRQNISTESVKQEKTHFSAGMQVCLKGQQTAGTIVDIQADVAVVVFGQLKSKVKISMLEPISHNRLKKEQRNEHASETVIENVRRRKLNFKSEIDVRGMRGDEALQAVMYFIDDALMVGVSSVRILHGTGTGSLRQLIRQYLGTVQGIRNFHDEHVQFGGAGITVVALD